MTEITYNVLDIRRGTTVDGPGLRTSIYLAGCRHRCPGCHNPDSWDPAAGSVMTLPEIMEVIKEEDFDVTLTGGDPLMQPEKLQHLIREIKKLGKNIWLYTGYTINEIRLNPRLRRTVAEVDTVVEGPFIIAKRDTDLRFRGSTNQRIIALTTTDMETQMSKSPIFTTKNKTR